MLPFRSGRSLQLIVVALTSLTAVTRWIRPGLPIGPDAANHLMRAVELDWLLAHGYLYPRWAPDMVFGYGYPLFNFYSPMAYYAVVLLHRFGFSFVNAMLAAFIIADLLGALGTFSLARRILGDAAGMVAAVAYVYAPYIIGGSLHRGALPEALALGLLPWLLWAFYRLYHAPTPHRMALACGLSAISAQLHNISAVLASATLTIFLGTLTVAKPKAAGRFQVWLAFAAGLMLSAFFWLPAALESRYVHIANAYGPWFVNFHSNFLSVRELLTWPQPFDRNLLSLRLPQSLGLPQVIVAIWGFANWRRRTLEQKALLGLAAAGVIALSCLTLPESVWLWDHLPGFSLIQFPARLLGPASLLTAFLAGAAFPVEFKADQDGRAAAYQRFAATLIEILVIAAIILFGLPWAFERTDPLIPPNPALLDMHALERRTGNTGTTSLGEYMPIWVKDVPPADSLRARYAAGAPINRLDPASLPAGAQIIVQTTAPLAQKVELDSPTDFTALFDVFYFPGWQATVDGAPAPIGISTRNGLIAIPLPAGRHTVEIHYGTTPVRVASGIISLTGLGVLIAVIARAIRHEPQSGSKQGGLGPPSLLKSSAVGSVALALFIFKVAVADHYETVFARTRFDGTTMRYVQAPLNVRFGDQIALIGYDACRTAVPSGRACQVTTYWRALQPLRVNYSISLALTDAAGHRFAQADSQHPGSLPTSTWPSDMYVQERQTLTLLPGTPPGTYQLVATVYRFPELVSLSPPVPLGQVIVTRPPFSYLTADLQPSSPHGARFGPLQLIGADLGASEIGVGQELHMTFYWRAAERPAENYSARVALVASDGTAALQADLDPVRSDYGTSLWAPGESLRAPTSLHIPATLAGGHYAVTLTVLGSGGALAAPVALGTVFVVEPQRTFVLPPVAHTASSRFGDIVELAGWDLNQNRLVLYWRALSTADRSYTVFIHVLDSGGSIFSQRDSPPMRGARPTTSWVRGEVIADDYLLDLPPGGYTIQLGIYDQATGARLKLEDGDDHLVLVKP